MASSRALAPSALAKSRAALAACRSSNSACSSAVKALQIFREEHSRKPSPWTPGSAALVSAPEPTEAVRRQESVGLTDESMNRRQSLGYVEVVRECRSERRQRLRARGLDRFRGSLARRLVETPNETVDPLEGGGGVGQVPRT